MTKYAVVKIVNGSYALVSEWDNLPGALVNFHNVCMTHWNSSDVTSATIAILDAHLNKVRSEIITHEVEETDDTEDTE